MFVKDSEGILRMKMVESEKVGAYFIDCRSQANVRLLLTESVKEKL